MTYASCRLALRSVVLDDIVAVASWSSRTTFTSHYLRDLSVQSDDLFRLGPLVVAKQGVRAPVRAAPRKQMFLFYVVHTCCYGTYLDVM